MQRNFRRLSMPHRIIRRVLTLFALAYFSSTISFAQLPDSTETVAIPVGDAAQDAHTWESALLAAPSKGKIFVVTLDQPDRRQSCHVKAITMNKLVCSRAIGHPRIYLPNQIAALILPGSDGSTLGVFLGLNAGLGAAIWGTVVLAAACPACAVGTGIAALVFFAFAGAIAYTDDVPDRLLYLAPGQQLSRRLGDAQF
jgi:hypothetical protein